MADKNRSNRDLNKALWILFAGIGIVVMIAGAFAFYLWTKLVH